MNDKAARGGTDLRPLLFVGLGVIIAKAAMHRRAMWGSGWGPSGSGDPGYGHHRRFGGDGADAGPSGFRLPPKIEWILDTWHMRAHQALGSTTAADDLADPADAPA